MIQHITSRSLARLIGATVLGSACLAGSASASNIGDNVSSTYYFPSSSSFYMDLGSATVGAGVEFHNVIDGGAFFDVDLDSSGVKVTFLSDVSWTPGAFNGFTLVDNTKAFDAAAFASSSNAGFTASNYNETGNTMSFNWQGMQFTRGDTIQISAVPEPESYAMLMAGLGLLGFAARRKQQS